jgi:signal transduction histidine kinase
MLEPAIPIGEDARLCELAAYGILDTPPEKEFDALAQLAAHILDVPIALVSLVDADRQWFKARVGLSATQTPRAISFCGHAVASGAAVVVSDAHVDVRFADNPAVVGAPFVRFYAGMPLRTPSGQVLGALCGIDHVRRDVTPRQLEMLAMLADQVVNQLELRSRNRQLERDIEARKVVQDMQAEFVATVSHELRTPLTSIRGALGLIANGVTGEISKSTKEFIDIALDSSERLGRLVDDILDVERLRTGRLHLAENPVVVADAVNAAVAQTQGMADARGVRIESTGAFAAGEVIGDFDRIVQVVTNLLSNAIKASSRGEGVSVMLTSDAGALRVAVSDRGPGIPLAFRGRIFGRFAQADGSPTRAADGTGLGLYISRSIARNIGGDIFFEDVDGGGTTFVFTLPKRPDGPQDA